jgi:hypothetical protein
LDLFIVLRFSDAFFDELLIHTPTLLILVVIGRNRDSVTRGAWHWIPAF